MKSTIIRAPAKVNLYLDVLNKRPDGYHNIETIFERIDLCDWIKISTLPKGIKVYCDNKGLPCDINNTAYKAAKLLIDNYNLSCGFKIYIDKRIPIASGLGGGSSNAASVLLGIKELLNLKINNADLLNIAKGIGADVPFFVSGYKRAHAAGIGEILTPLKQGQNMHFLLVVPGVKIYTASVYASLRGAIATKQSQKQGLLRPKIRPRNDGEYPIKLNLTKKKHDANILPPLQYLSINNIKSILFNKLEEIVLPSYPVLHIIKKALKKTGPEGILVSGSGATVYGIFQSRKEAVRAEKRLTKKGNWQLFLTSSY